MYKVIQAFTDRLDNGHSYNTGDVYPRVGFAPPTGRSSALCSGMKSDMNRTGIVYLHPVDEPAKDVAADQSEPVKPKPKSRNKVALEARDGRGDYISPG